MYGGANAWRTANTHSAHIHQCLMPLTVVRVDSIFHLVYLSAAECGRRSTVCLFSTGEEQIGLWGISTCWSLVDEPVDMLLAACWLLSVLTVFVHVLVVWNTKTFAFVTWGIHSFVWGNFLFVAMHQNTLPKHNDNTSYSLLEYSPRVNSKSHAHPTIPSFVTRIVWRIITYHTITDNDRLLNVFRFTNT